MEFRAKIISLFFVSLVLIISGCTAKADGGTAAGCDKLNGGVETCAIEAKGTYAGDPVIVTMNVENVGNGIATGPCVHIYNQPWTVTEDGEAAWFGIGDGEEGCNYADNAEVEFLGKDPSTGGRGNYYQLFTEFATEGINQPVGAGQNYDILVDTFYLYETRAIAHITAKTRDRMIQEQIDTNDQARPKAESSHTKGPVSVSIESPTPLTIQKSDEGNKVTITLVIKNNGRGTTFDITDLAAGKEGYETVDEDAKKLNYVTIDSVTVSGGELVGTSETKCSNNRVRLAAEGTRVSCSFILSGSQPTQDLDIQAVVKYGYRLSDQVSVNLKPLPTGAFTHGMKALLRAIPGVSNIA